MQVEQDRIKLAPMTSEMYRSYFMEYENDPDLYLPGQAYVHYEYSEEKVRQLEEQDRKLAEWIRQRKEKKGATAP